MGVLDFLQKMKAPAGTAAVHNMPTPAEKTAVPATEERAALPDASSAALLPAARQPAAVDALPAEVRTTAMERLTFIRLVRARKDACRCSDREAAEYVALNHTSEFPVLCRAGHGGATALHYNNYRNWSRRMQGLSDEEQILRSLCDNYVRGMQKRRGAPRFWQLFFAMYLNRNRLRIPVAYSRACTRMRRENRETPVPSLAQVRYQVNRLPPDRVILAREGEEAWRNSCGDFIRRSWQEVPPANA